MLILPMMFPCYVFRFSFMANIKIKSSKTTYYIQIAWLKINGSSILQTNLYFIIKNASFKKYKYALQTTADEITFISCKYIANLLN